MNSDLCPTCENSRMVPHPNTDRAELVRVRCPDCFVITEGIGEKYLANSSACPWCRGSLYADSAPDVDEGTAIQEICCLECGRTWRDVYRLEKMI